MFLQIHNRCRIQIEEFLQDRTTFLTHLQAGRSAHSGQDRILHLEQQTEGPFIHVALNLLPIDLFACALPPIAVRYRPLCMYSFQIKIKE